MEADKKEKLVTAYQNKREALVADYLDVFSTDKGKRILEDIEKQCRYHRNAFNPNSDRITSYNLGCLWVVQYIHRMLNKKLFEETKTEVVNEGINL